MGILVPKSHAQPSSPSQMTLVEGESSSGMSWVTIDVLKYHAQNNLGNKKKRILSVLNISDFGSLKKIKVETPSRNLEAGTEAVSIEEYYICDYSLCLLGYTLVHTWPDKIHVKI